jgi:two-component sensor histidine kinase
MMRLGRGYCHRSACYLLFVVQAVVARSFARKQTVKEAESAVVGRLRSLAQTHAMLIDKEWQGADLGEVVHTKMSPYADRVQVEGPHLFLTAKAAQKFALVFHECATNAGVYSCAMLAAATTSSMTLDTRGFPDPFSAAC